MLFDNLKKILPGAQAVQAKIGDQLIPISQISQSIQSGPLKQIAQSVQNSSIVQALQANPAVQSFIDKIHNNLPQANLIDAMQNPQNVDKTKVIDQIKNQVKALENSVTMVTQQQKIDPAITAAKQKEMALQKIAEMKERMEQEVQAKAAADEAAKKKMEIQNAMVSSTAMDNFRTSNFASKFAGVVKPSSLIDKISNSIKDTSGMKPKGIADLIKSAESTLKVPFWKK